MSRDTTPLEGQLKNFISDGTPPEIIARYESLPERAQRSDFGRFDNNVVVLDTETTGFSLVHDELTQIAAARVENGEIVDWFVTFVNPGKPIPEDVAHLTDIHDEDVADAPSASEALADLAAFIGDAVVVAHNAEFDRNFTTKHPTGYPLLENTWIDSLDLSRIALPRMKSHRLIDLVKWLSVLLGQRIGPMKMWRRPVPSCVFCLLLWRPCRLCCCGKSPLWRNRTIGRRLWCSSILPSVRLRRARRNPFLSRCAPCVANV